MSRPQQLQLVYRLPTNEQVVFAAQPRQERVPGARTGGHAKICEDHRPRTFVDGKMTSDHQPIPCYLVTAFPRELHRHISQISDHLQERVSALNRTRRTSTGRAMPCSCGYLAVQPY